MWDGLDIRDTYAGCSMGETAENLREKYNITREEQDQFALESQQKAKVAQDKGYLSEEIVPIDIKGKERR